MLVPLINRDNTCCFTGHRPEKLPWRYNEDDLRCKALKIKIYNTAKELVEFGICHFICGMALGCDTYFCEAILSLREKHPHITLEAAIPCEVQAERWSEYDRNRYFKIIGECDYETMVQKEYTRDCMIKRNKYMVDNSSVVIAVFDGTLGGTMQTVNYAKKKQCKVIEIKP